MINRQALLTDLQALLRKLEADLLSRTDSSDVPEVGEWLRAEYKTAKDAGRTAASWKEWLDDFITQVAAAWVLSCVFARFAEDNELIDPPRISGPTNADRLQRARDEYELYFRGDHLHDTAREYLLDVFAHLASLPAGKDLFGQHNPLMALPKWLGPDAAGDLLRFFQKIDSDTGQLVHNFTDTNWDTRFLGDLYQDLSAAARKKYALLQTPDFVEEFILDRTLEPALDEFGLTPIDSGSPRPDSGRGAGGEGFSVFFRMIDPACGSGHFLLGSFPRILNRWLKKEPGTNVRELVQRTLSSIHGVDINPFAIAIARFRLLLAALKACGIKQLADAPGFKMNLACGDSLYHGRQKQMMLVGIETDESHYFKTEDAEELKRILREGTFHAVVANPPYIVPKDRAANLAYRGLYPKTCHMKYSLSVPFMERIFELATSKGQASVVSFESGEEAENRKLKADNSCAAGFTGQITANSFMKREFGKKLIESFIPTMDLTHVIDTSGAYIPGHGTPTTILFGRNQKPISPTIRTVMGIKGEPSTPDDPAKGLVWTAIIDQIDQPGSESDFVSAGDSERERFGSHPWSIGGGGAAELKEQLDEVAEKQLDSYVDSIGITCFTLEDDVYINPKRALMRKQLSKSHFRDMVVGDIIRDWGFDTDEVAIFPYDKEFKPITTDLNQVSQRFLWFARNGLAKNKMFGGKTKVECGLQWFEYGRLTASKLKSPLTITYAEVATHNHFVLDRGGKVFKQTAPVIKLPAEIVCEDGSRRPVTEDDHLTLLGLLNSSTACFWMKQVAHNKGDRTDQNGARTTGDSAFDTYAFNATLLKQLPLPAERPIELAKQLDELSQRIAAISPANVLRSGSDVAARLAASKSEVENLRSELVRLQEDLDWQTYTLYDLIGEELTYASCKSSVVSCQSGEESEYRRLTTENSCIGQRAFEIVLARKMAVGKTQSTWFERHGSTPITELPKHWPDDYKALVNRRIEVIESNSNIALIEQPEYKRRWNTEPWDSQVERALRSWLLDRLESYFDYDGRMMDDNKPTAKFDIELTSVAKLADVARGDAQFMEVGEVYRNDPAFDVQRLVEELVAAEHVPMLPVLRYKPDGLRVRAEWEKTWELQRREDALSGQLSVISDQLGEVTDEKDQERLKATHEKLNKEYCQLKTSIPVPPKYKSSDFISTGEARFWALRGKLDVPKERWVSFPHCEGADGTLTIAWAGYNHLQLAKSISAFYMDVLERQGGSEDPRLVPLLGCLIELQPWLRQWHHDLDPDYNQRMDEVFDGFTTEQLKTLGLTKESVRAWEPPARTSGRQRRPRA